MALAPSVAECGGTGKSGPSPSRWGRTIAAVALDCCSIAEATELENYKWVNSAATGRTADQTIAQRQAALGLASNAYNVGFMADPRWSLPGHPGLEYVNWKHDPRNKSSEI